MSTTTRNQFPCFRLFIVALAVSFGGSFHFGYQIVITNPSQTAFLYFVNLSFTENYGSVLTEANLNIIWSAIIAILFVGAIIGALLLRTIAERVGRKRGLYITVALNIIASILSIVSKLILSFELYAIGRVVFGVSIGIGLGLQSIYLTECSPKQCRGIVNMMTGTIVQLGVAIGSITAMPMVFGTNDRWHYIYAAELCILVLVFITLPFMDESPRYLVFLNREQEARASIRHYHNCTDTNEIDQIVMEMRENVLSTMNSKSISIINVWRDPTARRGTLVGCTVTFGMAFSGIAAILAFSVQLLRDTGLTLDDASLANFGLSLISFIASLLSSLVVDRCGRRPLLLFANICIMILNLCIFALMLSYRILSSTLLGYLLIAVIALFNIAFSIGPGPLSYFLTSEMIGQQARSVAQSWTSLTLMISRTLLLAIYLPLDHLIGPYCYLLLFTGPLFAATVVLYFYLPETKNRNIAEVEKSIKLLPKLTCRFGGRRSQSIEIYVINGT